MNILIPVLVPPGVIALVAAVVALFLGKDMHTIGIWAAVGAGIGFALWVIVLFFALRDADFG